MSTIPSAVQTPEMTQTPPPHTPPDPAEAADGKRIPGTQGSAGAKNSQAPLIAALSATTAVLIGSLFSVMIYTYMRLDRSIDRLEDGVVTQFADLRDDIDARFEKVDARLDEMDDRIDGLVTQIAVLSAFLGVPGAEAPHQHTVPVAADADSSPPDR